MALIILDMWRLDKNLCVNHADAGGLARYSQQSLLSLFCSFAFKACAVFLSSAYKGVSLMLD